jgi:hypothetical protein
MKRTVFPVIALTALLVGCVRSHFSEDDKPKPAVVGNTESSAHYHSIYNYPLSSPGGKFTGLPPAVQNTVRAQAGAAELHDVVKDSSSGRTVYKIFFKNWELYPTLYVAPDGSVLNPDLTVAVAAPLDYIGIATTGPVIGIKPGDLPAAVMKSIQEHAPTKEISVINKETWNDKEVFIITFKDPAHNPNLYVYADGTVIR